MKRVKIYRMPLARVFPATHPRKGEPTFFKEKIMAALGMEKELVKVCIQDPKPQKNHTIRKNYDWWKRIIDEVNAGEAVLILYEWVDKPFRSKQKELFRFDKDSGIGIQKTRTDCDLSMFSVELVENEKSNYVDTIEIAKNDGLLINDFIAWFKGYDLSKPMAIIHFTKFRH